MTEKKPIQEALAAVMEDVRAVRKADQNAHQRFMFRGIDAVMNAVGPALRKHGVVVMPTGILERTVDQAQTKNGAINYITRVTVEYTFTGPAGDQLTAVVPGEAMDMQDKGTAKAMSVAFRTCLLQALCLPTDEPDPDSISHEETVAAPRPRGQQTNWQGNYAAARAKGRASFEAFLKWARQNNGPADMIAAGEKELAAMPVEGEIVNGA